MGNCCQVDETTKTLDKQLAKEEEIDINTTKILFLGAGGGGKSTIFKQLERIYNDSYETDFDAELKKKIFTQITEQMQTALKVWETSISVEQKDEDDINSNLNECIKTVQNHKDLTILPNSVADAIQFIWENNMVLKQSMNSMKFAHKILEETTVYYWDELERIKQQNYVPNQLDFLHLTHRTTGIVQRWFTINGKKFHIFDVGGQVSERKKWINCFDDVTALLFVVSLSCFNQTMFEDRNKNCMQDCMEIFEDVCNKKVFGKTDIILFFNKRDLFAEKIKNVAITDCPVFNDFVEYKDDSEIFYNDKHDYDQCASYIKAKFNALNHSDKVIYAHFTCAMEKDNIENVFDDVRNIILRRHTKQMF